MSSVTQTLPGIKAVGWLDCKHLPKLVALNAICQNNIAIFTTITPIRIYGEASCQCTTEKSHLGTSATAKLTFFTDELLPMHLNIGFVITDVNGKLYLVGSKEAPFPQVKSTSDCGTPDGDSAGYSYEVTHNALRTMIECIT